MPTNGFNIDTALKMFGVSHPHPFDHCKTCPDEQRETCFPQQLELMNHIQKRLLLNLEMQLMPYYGKTNS